MAIGWGEGGSRPSATERVRLFWLSLVPFVTAWMGENHFAAAPTALYGVVMLLAAIAYWILLQTILAAQGPHSILRTAVADPRPPDRADAVID
jgi:uncharacterized membrane protein